MSMNNLNRRGFLSLAAVGAGALWGSRALAAPVLSTDGPSDLFAHAEAGLRKHAGSIAHDDVVGIANFSPASRSTRLHLLDMRSRRETSFLVAHGRGSDPQHTGFLQRFSNESGSNCTSEGAYRTADYYVGKHGKSMRVQGLEATNSNAESRAIVVHGAWYVSDDMIRQHGMLGRSEGCFAVAEEHLPEVLTRLGPGRLLLAGKFA
ncbi:MAG: murein L,D-transpeptidase catalytic domain family protein [Sphingomonas sp.]